MNLLNIGADMYSLINRTVEGVEVLAIDTGHKALMPGVSIRKPYAQVTRSVILSMAFYSPLARALNDNYRYKYIRRKTWM
jgi:hypothetical protein